MKKRTTIALTWITATLGPALHLVISGKSPAEARVTSLVRDAHAAGLAVHPYTARADKLPPFASTMEKLLELVLIRADADGIFADHPDRAVSFLRATASSKIRRNLLVAKGLRPFGRRPGPTPKPEGASLQIFRPGGAPHAGHEV